ncbi:helix-turn-helix domain-containing protein [Catenuloplanes japonicus]|uniref:helix-turn-helix domain-containing protein n=1 Tax=Catenuloplanes japonicus TaxID=33876 RepID=UPI00068FBE3E|nr:helix-turn-helix transcriptional regulator [Catenuloplanes japonicus]
MAGRAYPVTPRTRRLGRRLTQLRRDAGLSQAEALVELAKRPGAQVKTASALSRYETGQVVPPIGTLMSMLEVYGLGKDSPEFQNLVATARAATTPDWWAGHGKALAGEYQMYIGYEDEATDLSTFEAHVFPGQLQTRDYASAVIAAGHPPDSPEFTSLLHTRMARQKLLHGEDVRPPLRLHTVISETVLHTVVGGPDVMRAQILHVTEIAATLPHVTVQVLRFAAGPHRADSHSFTILGFGPDEPHMAYFETLGGQIFLEDPDQVSRVIGVHDTLKTLAMPPADSLAFMKERAHAF